MRLALRGGRGSGLPATGRERRERRLDQRDRLRRAADHQAVTLLESEHPATRADIEVVNALAAQPGGSADVVAVVGVAAVDQHIAPGEQWRELTDHRVDDCRGYHDPHDARVRQRFHEFRGGGRAAHAGDCDRLDVRGGVVVGHALVSALLQAPHHVGAHATESDHSYAHGSNSFRYPRSRQRS